MSIEDKLTPDHVMREMSRLAMETAARYFAQMAREFASTIPQDCSGPAALTAFANAIESSSDKLYPKAGKPT